MEDMLKSSAELVRELAAECTLFLKKDGSFPLEAPCSVALFGNGARHTVRGGTGSGEVYSDNVVNMEDGLKAAGFEITTSGWLDSYDRIRKEEREKWLRAMKKQRHGLSGKYPLPEPFEIAAAGGDVLMPGSKAEYKALLKALKDEKISRRQLEINASRIIKTAPGR